MKKPTLGWQSWSPPYAAWHGFPRWDYSPHKSILNHHNLKSRRKLKSKIIYWCSWYAHDTKINDSIINKTLSIIKDYKLSFTHILIDDGWTARGDWLKPDPTKFPDLKNTIDSIHQHKLKAGIWFSPFLADSSSDLYQSHPDWFVKHKNKPVQGLKTMPIWESLIPQRYLLNFDLSEVKSYTKKYLKLAVEKWGVDLIKLDFLYAPYFDPNHKTPTIPTLHLTWLLSYLKNTYPHIETVACGAPFEESSNLVDVIRVSKDTALPPFVPKIINRIVYQARVNMLKKTLMADIPPQLNLDPDVRMFDLDTTQTSQFWDTIQTPVLGVGDSLLKLSDENIMRLKLWLQNLSSRS